MTVFILNIVPILSFAASLGLLGLATYQFLNPSFHFWPPPDDQLWKRAVFMGLFRTMVYGLVVVSALHLWQSGAQVFSVVNISAILLIFIGFLIAFAATGVLGWSNAFGSKEGLRTSGIFKYSRNPIYIATWLGLAGWALLVPQAFVVAALLCWGLLYLVAIFLEERWLAQEYGDAFEAYCRSVRRYL
ncbi:MAG: isoprenylcysteine carboxylmethyltransferase family protein [Rhodobacteraceae bacterium]|nr:isoprenylcysteine carboxylmethyltransferase family protein [Paracoccaceae bacterium]MCW9044246.1 isoprenylcysteine carboxylmethyltransferase family protein [Pseudopelagicola sp.]